jgi:hypothetical protein
MDTGSIYEPFLFPLITGSDPNLGNVREIGGGGLAFFNNATGQTTSASILMKKHFFHYKLMILLGLEIQVAQVQVL